MTKRLRSGERDEGGLETGPRNEASHTSRATIKKKKHIVKTPNHLKKSKTEPRSHSAYKEKHE